MKTWKTISVLFFLLFFANETFSQSTLRAGKVFKEGKTLFIVDPGFGVERFDISDPRNPKSLGFVRILGITDIVARGQFLFVNQFADMVLLKFDPRDGSVLELDRLEDVFPERAEVIRVPIALFTSREEAIRNSRAGSAPNSSEAGSMSSLALKGSTLYAVNTRELQTIQYDFTQPLYEMLDPTDIQQVGDGGLETVRVDGNQLFVGSQLGMYIYDIQNSEEPSFVGQYRHTRSCDPVVVQDDFAYITLRDGTDCRGAVNQLDILNISNPNNPFKVRSYQLTNPHGLAISDQLLLVCDGRDGLRVFNAANPADVVETAHVPGFYAYDILYDSKDKIAVVSVEGGFQLFDLASTSTPVLLHFILFARTQP